MNEKPVGTLYDSDVFVFNLEYLKHKEVSSYYDKSKPSIIEGNSSSIYCLITQARKFFSLNTL